MTPRRRREQGLVRAYVVTDGRAHPTRNTLDIVTLVNAVTSRSLTVLTPERRAVMELCRGGALSVAEVAGYLALPMSVTKVLISDLVDSGHIIARAAVPQAQLPDVQLLQEVLDGLRARL
jgi:DNA-directed RNA polymerase specialized sigma24 family protein